MNIRHLIFGLLPLQSYGHYDKAKAKVAEEAFFKKIEGTGSEDFFKRVFAHIDDLPRTNSEDPCGGFDLDSTLIDHSIKSPTFAYQLKKEQYAFKETDLDTVFGFVKAEAGKDCIPPKSVEFKTEGKSVRIEFGKIVESIKKKFLSSKMKPKEEDVRDLIVSWDHASYRFMVGKPKCRYLMSTLKLRLMYKMTDVEKNDLIKEVLEYHSNPAINIENHKVHLVEVSERVQQVTLRAKMSRAFKEQIALIKALKVRNVKVFLNTATHDLYSKAVIAHFGLGIDEENVRGSFPLTNAMTHELSTHKPGFFNAIIEQRKAYELPALETYEKLSISDDEAIVRGIGYSNDGANKEVTMQHAMGSCNFVITSGDYPGGDGHMLDHAIRNGGFALVLLAQDKSADGWNNLKKSGGTHVRIQYQDDAAWLKETSPRATS
ncbi:unnamed protein product [Albugo candida]|uniref:Uncharacterized protein n=1 Tax=Albugo candida TaxID=65357 RepID=A0A024G5P0_9STRA|nr:unnamed protein product [Albugo candida]|eukprot:CCI42077.1 unnamed protein product [Albugo candida]